MDLETDRFTSSSSFNGSGSARITPDIPSRRNRQPEGLDDTDVKAYFVCKSILISGFVGGAFGYSKGDVLWSAVIAASSCFAGHEAANLLECMDLGDDLQYSKEFKHVYATAGKAGAVVGGIVGNVSVLAEAPLVTTVLASAAVGLFGGACAALAYAAKRRSELERRS